jgi:acetoin utilization deacetylase AcuC-like enzyme
MDPLAHMMLSSESFRAMATSITTLAARHCKGRAVFLHEGGYSDVYVPFCGLAVIEVRHFDNFHCVTVWTHRLLLHAHCCAADGHHAHC